MWSRERPSIDAAIIAPLIAVHVVIFLLPSDNTTACVYMLGYAASLAAASTRREFRHLLAIPVAGFLVGLAAEVGGVNAGIPFGEYEYVSLEAPRILGVPLSVPVMWGFYSYLTYLMASSIVTRRGIFGSVLKVAYASLLMVTLDLAMDPFMVHSIHAWIWFGGWGPRWFGVPASNFVGWFMVSFTILLTHELVAMDSPVPRADVLTVPYTCLLMFFASFIGPELAAPIAALLTAMIAVPALITTTTRGFPRGCRAAESSSKRARP